MGGRQLSAWLPAPPHLHPDQAAAGDIASGRNIDTVISLEDHFAKTPKVVCFISSIYVDICIDLWRIPLWRSMLKTFLVWDDYDCWCTCLVTVFVVPDQVTAASRYRYIYNCRSFSDYWISGEQKWQKSLLGMFSLQMFWNLRPISRMIREQASCRRIRLVRWKPDGPSRWEECNTKRSSCKACLVSIRYLWRIIQRLLLTLLGSLVNIVKVIYLIVFLQYIFYQYIN